MIFVTCKFHEWDRRSYTYTADEALALKPGDRVIVETKDGEKTVTVETVGVPQPSFECKAILRRALEQEAA